MPTATTSLTLATQRPFGTLTCDFYKNDSGEFYMTRTQIGKALEYKKADDGIQQIHSRNADRLDPLSSTLVLGVEVSNRGETYTRPQNVFVYSLKGVLEICRFSRQPKADKFMDFVWDVIISIMHGETVLAPVQQQQTAVGSIPPSCYLSKMEHSPAKAIQSGLQLMSATAPPGTRS